jgi:endogenous inhibitor of DNA gyrase (YacG/DUF329 family)
MGLWRSKETTMKKNCLECKIEFEKNETKKEHLFCSAKCRAKHWSHQHIGPAIIAELKKQLADQKAQLADLTWRMEALEKSHPKG